ncbi:MAG: signal peptidase I [Clostridium sp. 26_21]|nr:MAG: signal peptidase I [Clostridium sp. 26_21]
MKNKMIFLKQIFDIFFSIVFAIIILVVTSLIIQKYILKEEVPNIFGYKILQVMSGSMSGEFETGDTILIKEIKEESDLKIGDVITYRIAKNTLVTHRIVNITKIGESLNYTLKGDANNVEDSEKILFSSIEGIYVKKLILIGKIISFMQKPYGMVIIFVVPILLILYIINAERTKEIKRNKRREKRLIYEMQYTKEQLGEVQNEKK